MSVTILAAASQTYANNLATISYSDIAMQTSNLTPGYTPCDNGDTAGDAPIVMIFNRPHTVPLYKSKMKEQEPPARPTGREDGAWNAPGGGRPVLVQDLRFMQLKRLVVQGPRLKVCLIRVSFSFMPRRRVYGSQLVCDLTRRSSFQQELLQLLPPLV